MNESITPSLTANDYTAHEVFHREKQALFRNVWLLAGHTSQLPLNAQLASTIAGIPILLWHTPDGYKCFANICRHRGAPLLWDDEPDSGQTLRCRYHGWRYDTDGELISNTDFGAPCASLSLFELQLTIVQEWIFVAWNAPKENPTEQYPTLFSQLERAQGWTIRASATHALQCNWKVYVENYLEGYHIPYLHPSLSKEISMSTYQILINNKEIEHRVDAKENATNEGYWSYCWPNLAVNMYAQGMSIERILPVSSNETTIAYWYLFPPEATEDIVTATQAMSTTVTREDIQIVEAIQRNLESGITDTGLLSPKHEHGIAAFQRWVNEMR